MIDTKDASGYVVVLFGDAPEGWCNLTRCPQGIATWFPTSGEAHAYCETVPTGFEPHVLTVEPAVRGRTTGGETR